MTNKLFAQVISIPKEPTQIDDYVYDFTQRYAAHMVKTWNNFIVDELYEMYKKTDYTNVLVISKEDYEKFLKWALPKYKEWLDNDK